MILGKCSAMVPVLSPLLACRWPLNTLIKGQKVKLLFATLLQIAPPGALRVTGKVVSISQPGSRREQVVGVLQVRMGMHGGLRMWGCA